MCGMCEDVSIKIKAQEEYLLILGIYNIYIYIYLPDVACRAYDHPQPVIASPHALFRRVLRARRGGKSSSVEVESVAATSSFSLDEWD